MTTPTALKFVDVDDFTTTSAGDCTEGTVSDVTGEVVVPEVAVAVFVTPPALISASVVTYEPVQVIEAPGARPLPGNAGHETEAILLSLTVIGLKIVTLPLFVTV